MSAVNFLIPDPIVRAFIPICADDSSLGYCVIVKVKVVRVSKCICLGIACFVIETYFLLDVRDEILDRWRIMIELVCCRRGEPF